MEFLKERFLELSRSVEQEGMRELEEYVLNSDFFEAPASTKYHDCDKFGLVRHSLKVYEILKILCANFYVSCPQETIIKVALYHDLCKANFYKIEMKYVKTGTQWSQKAQYVIDDNFPFGHGEKSAFLINKFVKLTAEEACAVRWHMGAFDEGVKGGSASFNNAINKYKLVTLLNAADMIAANVPGLDDLLTNNKKE